MGHYPIKCVCCGKVLTNRSVLFDIKNVSGTIVQHLKGGEVKASSTPKSNRQDARNKADNASPDYLDDIPTVKKPREFEHSLKDQMTFPELLAYCAERELQIQAKYQDYPISEDFLNAEGTETEGLLTRLSFQKEKGGFLFNSITRYCPECGRPLPARSGAMPTYLVSLLGSTASGKTVYLCALSNVLSRSCGLPFASTLHSVPASNSSNELFTLSNALFVDGILPATTQRLVSEPLVFELTYSFPYKRKQYSKSCLFSINDMRGEDFAETTGEALRERGEFISMSDAFLTVISPLNIPSFSVLLSNRDTVDAEHSQLVHTALMSHLNNFVLPFFPGGQIDAPCVTMLSKSDTLITNRELLGIPPSNPVVAKDPPKLFTGTYFRNLHKGTADILRRDNALCQFLFHVFRNLRLTSVSAFGPNVKYGRASVNKDGLEHKTVENPKTLSPQHVADPILLLLIQLGFLPDFTQMELGKYYLKNNTEIMQAWMDRCICTGRK